MGRGLLSEDEDVVAGTYLGAAEVPEITQLVEDSDAPLLLGVILSDTNFAISRKKVDMRRAILAINREVCIGHHIYPDIPPRRAARRPAYTCGPGAARGTPLRGAALCARVGADATPLTSSDIACAINDLFAAHGSMPIACDIGDCLFTAMESGRFVAGYKAARLQLAEGRRPPAFPTRGSEA